MIGVGTMMTKQTWDFLEDVIILTQNFSWDWTEEMTSRRLTRNKEPVLGQPDVFDGLSDGPPYCTMKERLSVA